MGLTITTDIDASGNPRPVRVFRNDKYQYPSYSLKIASKRQDGSWINAYIPCVFPKGVEVNNKTDIVIDNAFYTCSEAKDGRVFTKIMITKFTKVNDGELPMPESGFVAVDESLIDEMPFQ